MALPLATARAEEQNGMVRVAARRLVVGTSAAERNALAQRFDCHPTWLNDDNPRHEAAVEAIWIDRFPVTNAQYLAFVEATGRTRPSWWNRWGGAFPSEYADHPAVGLSGQDAVAYANWAGKRLPSAEEWEAAVAGPEPGIFAWGDAWPGPLKQAHAAQVSWELPGTHPVGTGDCGRTAAGVEDFAGQVLEWVADVTSHNRSQFRLLKGAGWIHEDPLNYRVASGWYATETWQSAFSGVRCALDGSQSPPVVARAEPKGSLTLEAARRQLEQRSHSGPIALAVPAGRGRGLSIHVPACGEGTAHLMAPETVLWNRAGALSWRDKPDLTWAERSAQRAAYEPTLPQAQLQAEFVVHDDWVEQRFTATNRTAEPGELLTSSCFRLQGLPMFYDPEQLRTYALGAGGEFVPVRRLSRGNTCVRWITRLGGADLGRDPRRAVLAVVSRDQQHVIAAGRSDPATGFTLGTNTLFTCLHVDSSVPVAAGQQATTREVFWFLEGTLDTLRDRIAREFAMAE
jgi:formylglycine-generating enzyme required for sulfatase activity